MRESLPYGKWTCEDGREVLFNRRYKPIWQRRDGEAATPGDPNERVKFTKEEWFYSDENAPWLDKNTRQRCEAELKEWCPDRKLASR